MGQLSLCSQVLLLPLGVPPVLALACFTVSHSMAVKVAGCPLPQCSPPLLRGKCSFWTTKYYPSVVRSISRHFAIRFFCSFPISCSELAPSVVQIKSAWWKLELTVPSLPLVLLLCLYLSLSLSLSLSLKHMHTRQGNETCNSVLISSDYQKKMIARLCSTPEEERVSL